MLPRPLNSISTYVFLPFPYFLPPTKLTTQARAVLSIDLELLTITPLPGREFPPKYELPSSYPRLELEDGDKSEGLQLFHGSCHCAAVRYTLKSKPWKETEVMQCNCSLCSRVCYFPPSSSTINSTLNSARTQISSCIPRSTISP